MVPNHSDRRLHVVMPTVAAMLLIPALCGHASQRAVDLVGLWRLQSVDDRPTARTADAHYRLESRGEEIVAIVVEERDNPNADVVKGDEWEWARFKLQGRRLRGQAQLWKSRTRVPLTGQVSEDFKEIYWRWELPGSRDADGRTVGGAEVLRRVRQ